MFPIHKLVITHVRREDHQTHAYIHTTAHLNKNLMCSGKLLILGEIYSEENEANYREAMHDFGADLIKDIKNSIKNRCFVNIEYRGAENGIFDVRKQ